MPSYSTSGRLGPGKQPRPQSPRCRAVAKQSSRPLQCPGPARRCRATLQAGAGDLRESARPRLPLVASALNNLADLYNAQGRHADAEPLYKRALAIGEALPRSPRCGAVLNNLADLYSAQGRTPMRSHSTSGRRRQRQGRRDASPVRRCVPSWSERSGDQSLTSPSQRAARCSTHWACFLYGCDGR